MADRETRLLEYSRAIPLALIRIDLATQALSFDRYSFVYRNDAGFGVFMFLSGYARELAESIPRKETIANDSSRLSWSCLFDSNHYRWSTDH